MNKYELGEHLLKELSLVAEDLKNLKATVLSPSFRETCRDFTDKMIDFEKALKEAKLQYSDVLDDVFERFCQLPDDKKKAYIMELTDLQIFSKDEFNDFMSKKLQGNYFEMATAVARARWSSDFNPYYEWFSWTDQGRYPFKGDNDMEYLITDRMEFSKKLLLDNGKMKTLGYKPSEIKEIQSYFINEKTPSQK